MGTRRKRRWRTTVKTRAAVLAAFAVVLVLTPLDVAGTGSTLKTTDASGEMTPAAPAGDVPAPAEVIPAISAG